MPDDIAKRVCISDQDLFDDIDPYTQEIYDLAGDVTAVVKASVARTFVDLNRAPEDRPPANSDGVVKTATCHRRPIYCGGLELDHALVEQLIARYHEPYHTRLELLTADKDVRLGLDCHSMSRFAPVIARDAGSERPLFCLSNGEGLTCPNELLVDLAKALEAAFGCRDKDIRLNDPFKGGFVTRRHGMRPVPWIQVEMNRKLYLGDPWFDSSSRTVVGDRLTELRERFRSAVAALRLN